MARKAIPVESGQPGVTITAHHDAGTGEIEEVEIANANDHEVTVELLDHTHVPGLGRDRDRRTGEDLHGRLVFFDRVPAKQTSTHQVTTHAEVVVDAGLATERLETIPLEPGTPPPRLGAVKDGKFPFRALVERARD